MTANTGMEAKRIWDQIFQSVFTVDMSIKIAADKIEYLKQRDNTYFDLRNTTTAMTVETINYLIDTPGLTWENRQDYVQTLPRIQQGFLFDRFCFVDEYLSKVGTREFFDAEKVEDFLRWGLIDIWDLRLREKQWQ